MRRKARRNIQNNFHVLPLVAKTDKQQDYLDALRTSSQVFAIGPAGTGKTYLPTAYAGDLIRNRQIEKIVLTRPNVPAGPSLGFFPGEMEEKMAPWVVPFMETLKTRLGDSGLNDAIKRGSIEVVPFETMRGRTFNDSIILVDEAQNLTPSEMYMVVTRIGEEAQLIITGDIVQKDIKGDSGLEQALSVVKRNLVNATLIEFGHEDVVRGGICAQWVKNWGA